MAAGRSPAWEPNRLAARAGGAEVCRSDDTELRAGDRIRWTRYDKGLGLINSKTTEVAAVAGGKSTFRLEVGRMLDVALGDPQLRHIDRARASTVHAFQGRTVDTVIDAMEANHPHLTTQMKIHVEISLARDMAERVAGNKAALREQLEAVTGERIAALEGVEHETGKADESAQVAVRDSANGGEKPELASREESEKANEPKSIERDFTL